MKTSKFTPRQEKINKVLKAHLLDNKDRTNISREFAKLGDYHREFPIDIVRDVLTKFGLVLLDIDNTEYSAIFCGREGTARINVGYAYTEHKVNGISSYTPIDNSMLIFNWYKMNTCYEINIYMS